jgi:hypothetical protein
LPDPALLICGPAFDGQETARSLTNLNRVNLPNATRLVITHGKFDTGGAARTLNVDSGYPAEPPQLQTLAAFAGRSFRTDPRFRDGYDLYCIRRVLEQNAGFDLLLLLRDPAGVERCWPQLLATASENPIAIDGEHDGNLLLNLHNPRCGPLLELAWTSFRSGAACALQPYSLGSMMQSAADALNLVASCNSMSADLS